MKRESLSNRILTYFKKRRHIWTNGGEIERLAMDNGYKGSTAAREMRHLSEPREDYVVDLLKEERKNPTTKITSIWYTLNTEKHVRYEAEIINGVAHMKKV